MILEKKEQIKSLCKFIDNFNGELVIRGHEIYNNGNLVATFKGNKAYIVYRI